MAAENNGNNDVTLLITSINQHVLSQAGFACWLGVYEQPVILKGKSLLVTEIKDGNAWIHITFGTNLRMRTETFEDRKKLIAWAYSIEGAFSKNRDYLGLTGPGDVTFLKTEGDFSQFLLPQKTQPIPRHRLTVAYG